MEFTWIVYKEDKVTGKRSVKAGFTDELSAREYASMMRDISRMAGYSDRYVVAEGKKSQAKQLATPSINT